MTVITTNATFGGIDVDAVCRNWRTAADGNEYAMGNRFAAVEMLAAGLNHAAARQIRRPQFQMNTHPDWMQAVDSDPLYSWRFPDDVEDGLDVIYRLLMAPRESGSGDCYAGRQGSSAVDRTPNIALTRSLTYPADLLEVDFEYARGAAVGELTEGLSTFNDFAVVDVQVFDKPIGSLDTATHTNYVDIGYGKPGDPILSNHMEAIRAAFHALRSTSLPILSNWCATAVSGVFQVNVSAPALGVAKGDQFGVRVFSNDYKNVLDLSSTVRTATTAGIPCFIKNTGIGRNAVEKGYKLRVQCRVLARMIVRHGTGSGASAGVKIFGPLGDTSIIVNSGTTQWWGDSGNYIDLDTSQDDDETSADGNKIDVMGWGLRVGEEVFEGVELQLFGWIMWVDYHSYW